MAVPATSHFGGVSQGCKDGHAGRNSAVKEKRESTREWVVASEHSSKKAPRDRICEQNALAGALQRAAGFGAGRHEVGFGESEP